MRRSDILHRTMQRMNVWKFARRVSPENLYRTPVSMLSIATLLATISFNQVNASSHRLGAPDQSGSLRQSPESVADFDQAAEPGSRPTQRLSATKHGLAAQTRSGRTDPGPITDVLKTLNGLACIDCLPEFALFQLSIINESMRRQLLDATRAKLRIFLAMPMREQIDATSDEAYNGKGAVLAQLKALKEADPSPEWDGIIKGVTDLLDAMDAADTDPDSRAVNRAKHLTWEADKTTTTLEEMWSIYSELQTLQEGKFFDAKLFTRERLLQLIGKEKEAIQLKATAIKEEERYTGEMVDAVQRRRFFKRSDRLISLFDNFKPVLATEGAPPREDEALLWWTRDVEKPLNERSIEEVVKISLMGIPTDLPQDMRCLNVIKTTQLALLKSQARLPVAKRIRPLLQRLLVQRSQLPATSDCDEIYRAFDARPDRFFDCEQPIVVQDEAEAEVEVDETDAARAAEEAAAAAEAADACQSDLDEADDYLSRLELLKQRSRKQPEELMTHVARILTKHMQNSAFAQVVESLQSRFTEALKPAAPRPAPAAEVQLCPGLSLVKQGSSSQSAKEARERQVDEFISVLEAMRGTDDMIDSSADIFSEWLDNYQHLVHRDLKPRLSSAYRAAAQSLYDNHGYMFDMCLRDQLDQINSFVDPQSCDLPGWGCAMTEVAKICAETHGCFEEEIAQLDELDRMFRSLSIKREDSRPARPARQTVAHAPVLVVAATAPRRQVPTADAFGRVMDRVDLFDQTLPIWEDWAGLYAQRDEKKVSKEFKQAVARYLVEAAAAEKEKPEEGAEDITDLDRFYMTLKQGRSLLDSKKLYGLFLIEVATEQLARLKLTTAVWQKAQTQLKLLRALADSSELLVDIVLE